MGYIVVARRQFGKGDGRNPFDLVFEMLSLLRDDCTYYSHATRLPKPHIPKYFNYHVYK